MENMEEEPGYAGFHTAVRAFIRTRLRAKLDKLKEDDPKRQQLMAEHEPHIWLADAARRVQQIQAVTHSLKPIHPDARGTNLYVDPSQLPPLQDVGSHALGADFDSDVVGNAAALDVYKLLKLQVGGQTLLAALLAKDPAALQALHDDATQAQVLRDAFVSLTEARAGGPSSHTRAKQLYWLTGDDASDDAQYELLAPLYATSLAHAVYAEIQAHRFGDANKAARIARRERKAHDGVFYDYPGLAAQKMGGTKPQNISQLNSERGGVNYLLSSLPPVWKSSATRLPVGTDSVFNKLFISRPEVRQTVRALRQFLQSEPPPNLETRERREALIDTLVDELVALAGELQQSMPAGWTMDTDRFEQLHRDEQLWLDPLRTEMPQEAEFAQEWLHMDWPAEIGKRFGRWLNQQLQDRLPVGDVEAREWAKELLADEDGFRGQLRALRSKLESGKGGAA
ncbi:type I-F CRISPR-associated protein Csy1 [Comamonas sp. NoAH]|uniref:type I-F CRISPR-associated protein Csy1 n=1 Tax=Comamonas halotolerans TaxID=3041496 RepID=UPI0024E1640F|nr:type I-F CRISPR-associated protein Csy1 [Comamonas sp. NoAH]